MLKEMTLLSGNVGKKKALESCSKRLRVGAEAKAIRLAKLADNPIYAANEKKETENPILPGHVVWAKFKGCPTWPSLVMTHEEASANGLKGLSFQTPFSCKNSVPFNNELAYRHSYQTSFSSKCLILP